MAVLGLHCCVDLSLVTATLVALQPSCAGFSLRWLLIVEHGLLGTGSVVVALSSEVCGIFPD